MGAGDRERLADVRRLRRPGDAEDAVRRVRLVAVLRDPDPLAAVEPRQLGDERVDVAERDAAAAGRRRRRGLRRAAVVRVMRVGVEAGRARLLHRAQEGERRDGGLEALRVVVAARGGDAAGDLLAAQHRGPDPLDDGVADPRVVDRALDDPRASDPAPLRDEADPEVRLVPGRPVADAREDGAVGAHEGAAVARRGGVGELPQRIGAPRRPRRCLTAVRPGRRPEDREEHLDAVPVGLEDDPVVEVPVVRLVVGVCALARLPLRDPEPAAPVQVHAEELGAELLEAGEEVGGLVVVGAAAVGDPAAESRGGGCRRRTGERTTAAMRAGRAFIVRVSIGRGCTKFEKCFS